MFHSVSVVKIDSYTAAGTYRSMSLLLASKAEGGAALASDIKGLIRANVLDTLHSMLTVGRWAPSQALAVFHVAAQLILIKLLPVLI